MAKLRPLSFSRLTNQNADAVIDTAARLGSDGRGKNGLRGYMLYLARDHLVQFIALLGKMTRAELSSQTSRRPRANNNVWTGPRQSTITDAIFDATERLGSDGRGRGGTVGYFRSIASRRPAQFMKILSLLLDIQEFELRSPQNTMEKTTPSLTVEEIKLMTLEEKQAKYKELLAASPSIEELRSREKRWVGG
jgi:hypothetical protein